MKLTQIHPDGKRSRVIHINPTYVTAVHEDQETSHTAICVGTGIGGSETYLVFEPVDEVVSQISTMRQSVTILCTNCGNPV